MSISNGTLKMVVIIAVISRRLSSSLPCRSKVTPTKFPDLLIGELNVEQIPITLITGVLSGIIFDNLDDRTRPPMIPVEVRVIRIWDINLHTIPNSKPLHITPFSTKVEADRRNA
jgi:hypothetical protein